MWHADWQSALLLHLPKQELTVRVMGFFNKLFSKEKKQTLDNGLERTKQGIFSKITRAVAGKSKIDDDVLSG